MNPPTPGPARNSRLLAGCPLLFAGLQMLSAVAATAASLDFQRVNAPGVEAIPSPALSAAWGDYDSDGLPDLAFALPTGGIQLFRQTAGGFGNMTSLLDRASELEAFGVSWADYDNDGDLDLFVAGKSGPGHALYRNNGNGSFSPVTSSPLLLAPSRTMTALWADNNRDGFLDVLLVNGGGDGKDLSTLFLGSAGGTFSRLETGPLATTYSYGFAGAWADFDGDGDLDLVIGAGWDGPNLFFSSGPDGALSRITPSPAELAGGQANSAGVAWGDFDNDGDLDVWNSSGVGPGELFRNDGKGVLTRVDGISGSPSLSNPVGAVWADFDNDGWLDLIVANRTGRPGLFRNLEGKGFERVTIGALPNQELGSNGIGVADVNRDGSQDIMFANWPGGTPTLYTNSVHGNHWLRIRPVGTTSNRQGIGARVTVSAVIGGKALTQVRQVGGEDGWGTQEAIAHFGLGSATAVSSLRIDWPSGLTTTLVNLPADQVLTIREGDAIPNDLAIVPSGGYFMNAVVVGLVTSVQGGEIRYTLDGSAPSINSHLYTAPFEIRTRTIVQAQAYLNGFPASTVAKAEFIPDPGVQIVPNGGPFTNSLPVALTTSLTGVTLRYTTDGTDPSLGSAAYSEPFRVRARSTVKARAFLNGFPVSEIVAAEFLRVYAFESDGITADWRRQYFGPGYAYDPRAAQEADPDGDGASNLQEFTVGADPLDALSGFAVGIQAVPRIRFHSVAGKTYRIVRRETASSEPVVVQELLATEAETTWVDVSIGIPTAVYVVEPVP